MAKPSKKLLIRELEPAELPSIYPMLKILNPSLKKATFAARLKAMKPLGYRAVAVFDGKRMIGLSGFWIRTRFWCGRELDLDNFVVHPDYRNRRIGAMIVEWLDKKAVAEQCDLMVLDAYAHRYLTHRFYIRSGFSITGYHFTKIPGSTKPLRARDIL